MSPADLDLFPMSFAQQRLWLLDQLHPGTSAYAIPLGLLLDGPLDRAALAAALDDLAARHETLRTTFILQGQEALQAIAPPGGWPLEVVEADGEPQATAAAALDALARVPFDLARGPLVRARLLAWDAQRHALLLVLHHIVADGWSVGVLMAELAVAYGARRQGQAPQWPELQVQYADYAAWQRESLTPERHRALAAYWRQALAGIPASLGLPCDHPRPARQGFRGALQPLRIAPGLAARLAVQERLFGATRAMALLAAWAALLARLSSQSEVVVGMPVAGRVRPELEPLIGFFVNTLPVRLSVTEGIGFGALLAQAGSALVTAQAHQDLPFEQIVELVDPPRELGTTPLFQTLLSFHSQPRAELALPGLAVTPLALASSQGAKFDLSLSLGPDGDGGLSGSLEYDADLFEPSSAARLARLFGHLLEQAVAQPQTPLSQLPLLPADERARVLHWGAGPQRAWSDSTFIKGLAGRAVAQPQAPAALFPDAPGAPLLSYGQLWSQVQDLAEVLAAHGAGRGQRVAVCLERGPALLVALLAVQWSGAAYVPLDPMFPAERLQWMVQDAAPVLTLSEAALRDALPPASLGALLLLQDLPRVPRRALAAPGPQPQDTAYVLYTSGSTGRPKGVQIPHRALTNFLHSMAEVPGFGPADRALALTTVSFDICALELYLPLHCGGSLVMAGRASAADPVRLQALMARHAPTVVQATPATWRMLLGAGWPGNATLKALCGGEALSGQLAASLVTRVGTLWNVYGPTETTVWSSCLPVKPRTRYPAVLPVGGPIANTWLYVLDRAGHPVPPGVAGEIVIGGHGVAQGYLNQPALTAERFVPDPFHPGGPMYRTGDLGRWQADGRLEFLGRSDFQVKVRGFRIELGDIEATLEGHPAVAQAVVVARGAADAPVLTAYLVVQEPLETAALRTWLQTRLPDYMLPGAWAVLEALPLTPNGKVDRKALPPVERAPAPAGEPPRDADEARMAAVWQEVLGLEAVWRDDDFFVRGGHSLAAVAALLALQRAGYRLQLSELFAHPTPARLAARWRELSHARPQVEGVVAYGAPTRGAITLVLVPGAGGDPAYLAPLASALAAHAMVLALVAPGLQDGQPPAPSLEALAGHYRARLEAALPPGPFVLVGHSLGSFAATALASRWQDPRRPLRGLVVLDTVAPVLDKPAFDREADEGELLRELAAAIAHLAGEDTVSSLPPGSTTAGQWLAAADQSLRRQGHAEVAQRLLPMAAVYRAGLGYRYRCAEKLGAPVALLKASERINAPDRRPSGALLDCLAREDWGWGELSPRPVHPATIPGDHLTLAAPAHAAALAAAIGDAVSTFIA